MPLSQYKRNELYKHVESFELADPKMFEDAVITNNLCICEVKKAEVNKFEYSELSIEGVDQNFRLFYEWNIAHSKGIYMSVKSYKKPEDFDENLDFLETSRCTWPCGGGRFGPASFGYAWNVLGDHSKTNADIGCIHFETKKAKDNFTKYVYSYKDAKDRINTLNNRACWGCHSVHASGENFYIWPQIDWEAISDHELWKKGMYDEAVLDTMGLKWNEDKTCIVKK